MGPLMGAISGDNRHDYKACIGIYYIGQAYCMEKWKAGV